MIMGNLGVILGIMENKMETTIVYWGYIGVGLGFRVQDLGFGVQDLRFKVPSASARRQSHEAVVYK